MVDPLGVVVDLVVAELDRSDARVAGRLVTLSCGLKQGQIAANYLACLTEAARPQPPIRANRQPHATNEPHHGFTAGAKMRSLR
jgi:hypothetical protein